MRLEPLEVRRLLSGASVTTLASSVASASYGQSVTLTATVAPASTNLGTRAETVTFWDGKTQMGTASLDGNGTATLGESSLVAGTHLLSVSYGGDTNYSGSSSVGTTSLITTVAGSQLSYGGDGGPATAAFGCPVAIAVDSSGNLFIADNSALRRVDYATGVITTVAGGQTTATAAMAGGPPRRNSATRLPWQSTQPAICSSQMLGTIAFVR